MLEIGKRPEMGHSQDSHDFTIGREASRSLRRVPFEEISSPFATSASIFFAEFVQYTENIRNFVYC